MKKYLLQSVTLSGIFFFTACGDPATKETTISTSAQKADSVKKTTISIGPGGTGVKTKNTEVQVNGSGVKVGTKDVNVDIKTGK